jgi:hypothetical protein
MESKYMKVRERMGKAQHRRNRLAAPPAHASGACPRDVNLLS